MSWHFSQALVAEFWEAICWGTKLSVRLSVTPMPAAYYWPDKTTEHSRLSRFGMTSEPLMESVGEELLTWFLEDFRAKTLVSLEVAMDSKEREAAFGLKWQGWFAKYDRDSSSWKTAQHSLLGDLDEFSETWPRWGSMRNGASFLRPASERAICGSVSGLLPTLVARDYRHPGRSRFERTGSKAGDCLPQALGGPVRPMWAEWFMGWPIGWIELKPLATAKFHEWQQQHSLNLQADLGEPA